MSDSHAVDVKKTVKVYITVFVALMALTVITVGVSYFHLPIGAAIVIALIIATVKGSLVASYFMHLISEKKIIYLTLGFTAFFVLAMMVLMMTVYATQPVIR
jgi:cytochrome c oxidase subunit 4